MKVRHPTLLLMLYRRPSTDIFSSLKEEQKYVLIYFRYIPDPVMIREMLQNDV